MGGIIIVVVSAFLGIRVSFERGFCWGVRRVVFGISKTIVSLNKTNIAQKQNHYYIYRVYIRELDI